MHLSTKLCVCVCVWERKERESNTKNGAESNPVVNVAKIIAQNTNRKLCKFNYQCVTSEHANCSNKVSIEAKHHQKTNMWFNPHSNSTMYARSPQPSRNYSTTHAPYNWAKADNQASSYVLHVILLIVLQTMPCYFIYSSLCIQMVRSTYDNSEPTTFSSLAWACVASCW
jgi:hypothetical protein